MVVGIEEIEINGNSYSLKQDTPLIEGVIEEWPDNVREQGQQALEDRRSKSAWLIQEVLGVGARYQNDNNPFVRAQSSLVETRWGEITHLPLVQDSASDLGSLNAVHNLKILHHSGELIALFNDDDSDADIRGAAFDGSSDTWALNGTTIAAVGSSDLEFGDAHTLKDKLNVYFIDPANADLTVVVVTGWISAVGSALDIVSSGVESGDTVKAIEWSPTTSVVAWLDASLDVITVYKNTDNWATNGTTTLATINASALNSITRYYDLSGNLRVMLGTDIGVWAIDVSTANNETLVVDLQAQADANNCKGMTVWNGKLIVPLAGGSIDVREWTGGSMISYPLVFREHERARGSRVFPSGWGGHVTCSVPTDDWLFLWYGGNASGDTAHLFAVDRNFLWHVIAEHDTSNEEVDQMIISAESDGQSRLHFISVQAVPDYFHIDDPLINPRLKSIPGEASNVLILPEFTGGMPHIPKVAIQLVVDAEGLSATNANEFINADYGINDNTVDVDLGDFLSGDTDLVFGSGAGVEFNTTTLQLNLKRDASVTTDRVYVRSLIFEYLVVPDRLETYDMIIDLQLTAQKRGSGSQVKDIIDELNTVQGSKTMVTFSYWGRTQVRVLPTQQTVTQADVKSRFEVQDFNPAAERYLRLVELL